MLSDLIAQLSDKSDEFKLLAIQSQALPMYAQPSQLRAYLHGQADELTLKRERDPFVFTAAVEVLP